MASEASVRAEDEREGLIGRLREAVGEAHCLHSDAQLFAYECDGLTLDPVRPSAVVLPATTDEVAAVVRICREYGRPFVPRGAGTGLSGGAHATEDAVLISLARMRDVVRVDVENRLAVVQPGVVNADLSRQVAPHGLFYAPDPSSQQACTIGGNVGENSGGPHTLKYGTTTHHVLALQMVLPDGDVVRIGDESGAAPGYDLVGAVVGSEGTLGILTELTVKLTALPERVETLLAIFDDVVSACRLVGHIIRSGLIPAALEIIDQRTIEAVESSVYAAGMPRDAGAILIIELDGSAAELGPQVQAVELAAHQSGVREVQRARDEEERVRFWRARKGAFGAMGRLAPDLYVHDAVVPRSRLPEILERICAIADRHRIKLSNVFHAGDGNLHPNISFDRRDEDELARVMAAGREILELCVSVGGVLTGEHGVGLEKRDFMELMFDECDLEAMMRLKLAFNPDGLCNPCKIIPMTRTCVESHPGNRARAYERIAIE